MQVIKYESITSEDGIMRGEYTMDTGHVLKAFTDGSGCFVYGRKGNRTTNLNTLIQAVKAQCLYNESK